jgi:hypothetical protein
MYTFLVRWIVLRDRWCRILENSFKCAINPPLLNPHVTGMRKFVIKNSGPWVTSYRVLVSTVRFRYSPTAPYHVYYLITLKTFHLLTWRCHCHSLQATILHAHRRITWVWASLIEFTFSQHVPRSDVVRVLPSGLCRLVKNAVCLVAWIICQWYECKIVPVLN